MAAVESLPRQRPLGLLEKMSSTRHALELYNNVSVSASYSRPGGTQPLRSAIFRALAAAIQSHPALSAIPVDEVQPDAYFVRLPQIDLERAVTFVARKRPLPGSGERDAELDELLEAEHNTNFKQHYGELPFWRLTVLSPPDDTSTFTACFVYHHALGDGQSGLAFHRALLSALIAADTTPPPSDDNDIPTAVPSPETPMLPALESLHPLPLSATFMTRAIAHQFLLPPSLTSARKTWTAGPVAFTSRNTTRVFTHAISPTASHRLLAACRAHGVTLTAALQSLVAAALFAQLRLDGPPNSRFRILRAQVPISLRRFLPASSNVNGDSLGTYVSAFAHEHNLSSLFPSGSKQQGQQPTATAIWTDASRVRRSIAASLKGDGADQRAALLRWAGPLDQLQLKKEGKARDCSFELTNVGAFHPSATAGEEVGEGWKVGPTRFAQSGDVGGAPIAACVAGGGDGSVGVTFVWLGADLEERWMEGVVGYFKEGVERLLADAEQSKPA